MVVTHYTLQWYYLSCDTCETPLNAFLNLLQRNKAWNIVYRFSDLSHNENPYECYDFLDHNSHNFSRTPFIQAQPYS